MGPTAPSIRAARAAAAADGDARPPRCCWRVAAADSFARWGRWSYGRCVRLHGAADMVSCDHHARPRMSHDTYNQGLRRFWRRSVQRGGSNNAESRVLGSRRCCEPGDEGTIRSIRALSAPSFAARSRVFTRNGEDASSGGYKFVRGASPQVFAWLPRRVPASAKVQYKYRLQGTK